LCGDIEANPGPSSLNVCTLNIRSLLNPVHSAAVIDICNSYSVDILALTETWIRPSSTAAELGDATPSGYSLLSKPRPTSTTNARSNVGGGVAFIYRENLSVASSTPLPEFGSFECIALTVSTSGSRLSLFNIYRPPLSSSRSSNFSTFMDEFSTFLSLVATIPHPILITGDFNLHVNQSTDSDVICFLSALESFNLRQCVTFPTHVASNTLDLVITSSCDTTLKPTVSPIPTSPSDHTPILTKLDCSATFTNILRQYTFRRINRINLDNFVADLQATSLIVNPPSTLDALVSSYNETLQNLLDKYAPLLTKTLSNRQRDPWFTSDLQQLKRKRRHLERNWLRSRSSSDLNLLRKATNLFHHAIARAKRSYYSTYILSNSYSSRSLWKAVNDVLHRKTSSVLPTCIPLKSLADTFSSFFQDKILKIHSNLLSSSASGSSPHHDPSAKPSSFGHFRAATTDEVSSLITSAPNKQCELDPIPTSLLKSCLGVLLPTITNIVNLSLASGVFPDQFKLSLITPLLKKPSLDKDCFANYRPISNLSFLSKLTERIVKSRLDEHLTTNSLYNKFQSAYTKFHSTETALLSLHDHIIRAMSTQQITGLCLLDLSAAFDTIDHNILLHRLSSWFGLTGPVLSWFSSYLTGRLAAVATPTGRSAATVVTSGVPQGSVLGPLLFVMYTTPLSELISSTNVNHHLYADDTQLFLSFSPGAHDFALASLQSTISSISTWMSANLLCFNPSKTEFLIIGSPQQLSRVSNLSLQISPSSQAQPVHSARNLGVIFDHTLSFQDQISAVCRSCYYHLRDLRRIRHALDFKTASNIATSLVHSKLDYCNSLYLNLPSSQIRRLQLVQNAAAQIVSRTSRIHHVTPILKSLHWLKIPERIKYKTLSLTYSAIQFNQPAYLRSSISMQSSRSTRSSSLITLSRPPLTSRLKIADRSFSNFIPRLWNSLPARLRQPGQSTTLSLSPGCFHRHLKTYLFTLSYPP
jgi:endonuclease/exonuclease/phosphatase family metal-dependent hydrolase